MTLNEHVAKAVLDAAHRAWSEGDVQGVLTHYVDDLVYVCNTGGIDGGALTIEGKAGMAAFLDPVVVVAQSMSVVESFQFHAGIGRARIASFTRHRNTGHTLSGSYRQIVSFRGSRICRLEEFHDAAKMAAFWRLVKSETLQTTGR
jgi:ketosteroid isomerase-like protein